MPGLVGVGAHLGWLPCGRRSPGYTTSAIALSNGYEVVSSAFAFAGDRQIAVDVLRWLVQEQEVVPSVLCIEDGPRGSHADELTSIYSAAGGDRVWRGSEFSTPSGLADQAQTMGLDFALSVHFGRLIREPLLSAPRWGWLNLHPSFVPYNRGWHTPTWAILEGTPFGVSLHRMVEEVDAGPVLRRRRVAVGPADTAQSLYQRALAAELVLLQETWPTIVGGEWDLRPNRVEQGTVHSRSDLEESGVRKLDREAMVRAGDLIDLLRALTTSQSSEAVYFEVEGRQYRITVDIEVVADGE